MKSFLLTANVGELLKVCVHDTRDTLKGSIPETYRGLPKDDEYDTPIGICSVYKFNDMRMYVTDKMIAEVSNSEIIAEMNFSFDPETAEFRYSAYIIMSFIVGHIIGKSDTIYKAFIEPYLEKIIFDEYDSSINVNAYNDFNKVEKELVGITDHIPLQDVIFQRGMSTYLDKPAPLDITVIDITNCANMFKAKDIFYI